MFVTMKTSGFASVAGKFLSGLVGRRDRVVKAVARRRGRSAVRAARVRVARGVAGMVDLAGRVKVLPKLGVSPDVPKVGAGAGSAMSETASPKVAVARKATVATTSNETAGTVETAATSTTSGGAKPTVKVSTSKAEVAASKSAVEAGVEAAPEAAKVEVVSKAQPASDVMVEGRLVHSE